MLEQIQQQQLQEESEQEEPEQEEDQPVKRDEQDVITKWSTPANTLT